MRRTNPQQDEGRELAHKNLWIGRLVHALTVTPFLVVHALTVTPSRINGDASIYILYSPVTNTSCSESGAFCGQAFGIAHIQLAPTTSF